jgi:protein gp37
MVGVRPHPLENGRYWDGTWNPVAGCEPVSPGCLYCYAARAAATLQTATGTPLYQGTTVKRGERYFFNGKLTVLPPDASDWTFPLRWKGAAEPLLGPGQPSLLWLGSMSELFHPRRPKRYIDRAIGTLVISPHLGLIITKCPEVMVPYVLSQPAISLQRWRVKLWLGFSAERQEEFDERWPVMWELAERGWLIFVSIAPMIGPVVLREDFLRLGRWVIVNGEEGPHRDIRPMKASWARAVRDQCRDAGIAFFMKQLSGKAPIPPDLQIGSSRARRVR